MEDASDFELQGYYLHHQKDTDTMEDTPFTKFRVVNGDCCFRQIVNFETNWTKKNQFQIAA